jgi:hypothetical protein
MIVDKKSIFDTYIKVRKGERLSIDEQRIYLIHIEGLSEEKANEKIDIELFRMKNIKDKNNF